MRKKEKIAITCPICSKIFFVQPCLSHRITCSYSCRNKKIRTGKKNSEYQKARVSEALKGKPKSEEHKRKLSIAIKGVPHPCPWLVGKRHKPETIEKMKGRIPWNFKGITSKDKLERKRFRKQMQKKVFKRDNYTCQICGNRGVNIQVDHIEKWSRCVEKRFDLNNCRTLCQKCHYKITFNKEMPPSAKTWGNSISNSYACV